MKLQDLNEESIREAAQSRFPGQVVHLDTTDLFLKDVQDGTYSCDFMEEPLYVSTQYAYHDLLINGNQTRYKLQLHTVELLEDEYAVNYSWKQCYYAVYEEQGNILFMAYPEFLEFVKTTLERKEQ